VRVFLPAPYSSCKAALIPSFPRCRSDSISEGVSIPEIEDVVGFFSGKCGGTDAEFDSDDIAVPRFVMRL
jgi:hypothetical protein